MRKTINKILNITVIILTITASILILYIHNIAIVIATAFLWVLVIIENRRFSRKKMEKNAIDNK